MTHSLLRSLIRETLLTEEVYGAQAVVYHGTNADPVQFVSALLNDEFQPGKGAGSMYGKGLYTVYDLKGTQTERGNYGPRIIKLKLNLYGYIIFDPDVALKVYKAPLSIVEQAQEVGADEDVVERLRSVKIDRGPFSSDAAKFASAFLKGRVKGVVYTGSRDGRCAVVYDPTTAVPIAWKSVRETSWTPVDRVSIKPALRRSASGDWEEEKYEADSLKAFKKIAKLPIDQRVVNGNLQLDASISSLPPGLRVEGDLSLGLAPITSLPADLQVGGELNLAFSQIKSLPPGLQIVGSLELGRAPISSLPPGLRVEGDLSLGLAPLVSLPDGLKVGGSIYLRNSPITSLPSDLQVGGNLDLSNTRIESVSAGLRVGGNLILSDTRATSLPAGLSVGGNLDVRHSLINSLPAGLNVGGDLYLSYTRITSLPDGIKIGGSLVLYESRITSLPKNLQVGGELSLAGTSIKSLPAGLRVGGNLNLAYTSIASLPEDLQVGRSIIGFRGHKSLAPAHLSSKFK